MVSPNEDCENWGLFLSRVIPVEGLHVAVLGGHGHAAQVRLVAHRLEVAAAQQKVYGPRAAPLRQRQGLVDFVQLPVAAAGHSSRILRARAGERCPQPLEQRIPAP